MKFMMIKLMMMMSMLTTFMNNPLSLGLILLMQTTFMSMLMNKIMFTSWFTMITFLMMIGGLLILFTYMSSIASNEKFKIKMNLTLIMFMIIIIQEEMLIENQTNEIQSMNMNLEMNSMIKLYNKKSMIMTVILVLYLLLTMIVISKIVKHHEGPLRSKN
uniref:NADH dehydrogenase subunit 6 n=1 Tax=Anagonalia emeiensis TaxID=2744606 RepID=UPI0024106046|nr:NADH dehydrogenase subunit 6 [Anagonalia emeiensis]WEU75309.1 NADH dehydrogenase subunit 6 [Anagonalia emeiensis]